jgi:hypothetical protein
MLHVRLRVLGQSNRLRTAEAGLALENAQFSLLCDAFSKGAIGGMRALAEALPVQSEQEPKRMSTSRGSRTVAALEQVH